MNLLRPQRLLGLAALCSVSACPGRAQPPPLAETSRSSQPWLEQTDLFTGGTGDYKLYRIPGLVVTKRGTLLAFCDARKDPSLGDWSQIDIFMRRSEDGGRNWAPPRRVIDIPLHTAMGRTFEPNPTAVAQHLGSAGQIPISNQMPIVDRITGAVHLLHCVNYDRCFYQRSDDDGRTFSAPVEITSVFDGFRPDYPWKVIATGPNHGIQLANGRLLVPVWLSRGGGVGGHRPSVVATIYSDDHGQTWQRGAIAAGETDPLINPSETVALEMPDGGVMLNFRSEALQHRRAISYSPDGFSQWTRPEFVNDLREPVCMAALERIAVPGAAGRSRLIFSNPDNCTEPMPNGHFRGFLRKNVTVKISYDEGRTWPESRTLEAGPSGYSDLAVLPDGTLCCFYERGLAGKGFTQNWLLTFARFNLAWVTQGRDHL